MNHKSSRNQIFILLLGLVLATLVITGCNVQTQTTGNFAQVPAGKAYAEGKEIYFTHTEASDQAVAEKLSKMMNSPVLYVPSLANVPESSLAEVYVFENGVIGKGPFGFQSDVFNKPPASEGYSPLRQILLVKWSEGVDAEELKSEAEILQAGKDGKLTTTKSGIVVNMPFIVWDGGKR
jgi:hypothetical protein